MLKMKTWGTLGLAVLLATPFLPCQVPATGGSLDFPLLFVENRGQYEDAVRYHVEHRDGVILFTDRAIVFRDRGGPDLVLEFPGWKRESRPGAESRSPTLVHYLIGKEADHRTDVPTYRRLRYAELWPGIDLVLRGERGAVKYELHVAPGADPDRIRMRYAGARLELDGSGRLEIGDEAGLRRTDPAPLAYQMAGGEEERVAAAFVLQAGSRDTVGFSVGAYDPTRPLVIDPAFLVYSGYLPQWIGPYEIAVDANGAAIVVGVRQVHPPYGDMDAFILRIRPDGTGLDFVTYLGGQADDGAGGVALDSSGIYVSGGTRSDERSFPVTVGPDLTFNNKGQIFTDGFVAKLAHDGKTLHYCGYIGGSHNDNVGSIAVDATGAAWVAGRTSSSDYPVKGGPQLTMPANPGCVTKVAPDGRSLIFSGYLGGQGPFFYTSIAGVAVDGTGDGYIAGWTGSDELTFPVTVGPSLTMWKNSYDVFLAKIDGRNGGIVYCGYIGGASFDYAWDVAVDAQGAAYVTGGTWSDETTFPVTVGPLLRHTRSGAQRGDGFVTKVRPAGNGLVYSGFLSGFVAEGVAVDAGGRCYLGGHVHLPYQPVLFPVGGALSAVPGGALDGFLARLSPDGRTFEYAGYLGGADPDSITGLALGPRGTVHVSGVTLSDQRTFPLKTGPSLVFNGWIKTPPVRYGSFVAKIAEAWIIPAGTGRLRTTMSFTLLANDDAGLPYQAGTSLGTGPIRLGSRTLGLSPDDLLRVSVGGWWPTVFEGYAGRIGQGGTATARLHIPNATTLAGIRLHTAFVTLDPLEPLGIKSISDTASFAVLP